MYKYLDHIGLGLWTSPLDLHTMTDQKLQVDYFNIYFQPIGFSSRQSLGQERDASSLNFCPV